MQLTIGGPPINNGAGAIAKLKAKLAKVRSVLEGIAKEQARFFSNIYAALAAFVPPIAPVPSPVASIGMSALVGTYSSSPLLLARSSVGIAPRTRSAARRVVKREREEGNIP